MHKYGRKAPINKPALLLKQFLSGEIPDHPASEDWLSVGGWQMLGNDQYGDCVAVTWANERKIMGAQYPTMDQVIEFYRTQNPDFPNQDNGMDIQTALEYLVKSGGPDGVKALAFAKVDYTNLDEVKAALAIFGQLWIGIYVQEANEEQFSAGQPWDYVQGSQDLGGHSIIGGGYDSDNTDADVRFVTWAQETGFTDNFWQHLVEECWVVIWPEHLSTIQFADGVDQQKLADAYKAITGRDFPDPAPTPAPTPVDVDQTLAAAGDAWLEAHSRTGKYGAPLAQAMKNWLIAHGYADQ